MALTNSRNTPYYVLFTLCALVLVLVNYELTFAVWLFTALISLRKSYSIRFLKFLAIPAIILLIAFIAAGFQEPNLYNYFRDIAYLLKPILGLLIGYNFCKILGRDVFKAIVYAGVTLAITHIVILSTAFVIWGIRSMTALRHYGGYFDDLEVYVLILLIFRKKLKLDIPDTAAYVLLLLVATSSMLYAARTNVIQFVILYVAMKGHLTLTRKSIRTLAIVIISVLAAYAAVYYSNPRREGHGFQAFLYKVKIAPIEPFKTKINKNDWKDFNDNYRSFENIITVRQMTAEGTRATIIGKGLGSTVDLGREVYSNDGEFIRYIPQLHNAYMTVFLKSGLIGVLLTLYFIYLLFLHPKPRNDDMRVTNYLLVGSALFLILSNWVFMGLYLKLDNKSLVIGALICFTDMLWRQAKNQNGNA